MIMDGKRHVAIFTTASLPWMTGTAVNPLFRAAYLAKDGGWNVVLVIPWLSLEDQKLVYPNDLTFDSPSDHEAYVRRWLEERVHFASEFDIRFYPGKFSLEMRSILAAGDITELISDEEADVAILEEPEHLTWYHHGRRWKTKFQRVMGVVHTNYLEYVRREKNGRWKAFLLKYINNWVVDIYCHKVIRLSAATQELPRSIVCNVHGVNPKFLNIGRTRQEQKSAGVQAFPKGAYYIGKMVWSKGYKELLKLLSNHQNQLHDFQIDLYGNGEDHEEVEEAFKKLKLSVNVYPGRDHADPVFHEYKVFINPSTSDVLCTTTAEALAMGKTVVCANHPSNGFFEQFSNCLMYENGDEFVRQTLSALDADPSPLADDQMYKLSWEAATERFAEASELRKPLTEVNKTPKLHRFMSLSFRMPDVGRNMEDASAFVHNKASGNETTRRMFGAVPGTLHPDEEQCKVLGLRTLQKKVDSRRRSGQD